MGVTQHGRTHRLDLADPDLREWECTVLSADPEPGIVLDRSPFYPGGGAQRPDFKARVEDLVNAEVGADRRVATRVLPREEVLTLPDIIRTQTNLIPPDETEVRIVDIVGLDVQADGGTHVASTAQIGKVRVVKGESKGKANRRGPGPLRERPSPPPPAPATSLPGIASPARSSARTGPTPARGLPGCRPRWFRSLCLV